MPLLDVLMGQGGANSSILDRLLESRTPGINPNAPGLPALAQQNNFGRPPVGTPPTPPEDESLVSQGLSKLGKPGRALMPISQFLGKVSEATTGAAERGTLGALAPRFQAGVQQGLQLEQGQQRNDLNERFVNAQIERMKIQNEVATNPTAATSKPLTEFAKLQKDFENGLIPEDVYQAKRNELINQEVDERFTRTQSLRGEFSKETKDIGKSLQSLSAAGALISNAENPISDLAAFISTIKSIDNSTVREGELAAFNNMQGLLRSLENDLAKAKGEGFSDTLRQDISQTIQSLEKPLRDLLGKKQEFFRSEAGKFNLDADSIAGTPFSSVDATIAPKPSDPPAIEVPPILPGEEPVGSI